MGVDATAAAKEATEVGRETSTLLSREALRHPSPPGLPGTHLSPGTVVQATSLRAASAACGTVHAAGGEGRGAGVPGGAVQRGMGAKRGEGGTARWRQGAGRAAGVEEGRKKGEGGREGIGGGNNVAGAAPAEFRFRTPPPRFDLGTSRRLPGVTQDAKSGAAGAPRAPRPGGFGGHRLAGAGETAGQGTVATAARLGSRPTRTPPRQDPRAGGGVGR